MTYLPVTLTLTPAEKMQRDMALVGVGTCLALVETNRPPQAASAGLRQTPASTAHVPTLRFTVRPFCFVFLRGRPGHRAEAASFPPRQSVLIAMTRDSLPLTSTDRMLLGRCETLSSVICDL